MPALLTSFLNALGLRRVAELEREVSERKEAEAALAQKTTLVQLLHAVATTANQALAFEDALQACLDLVCVHIHWPVGHVYLANPHDQSQLVPTTFWHLDEVAKFEPFRLEHLGANPNFCRAEAARSAGLRTGLACPVLVGMEVVAILEFFTTEAVPADDAFLIAMSHVGTQLSRVIERGRAREALQESEARFRSV